MAYTPYAYKEFTGDGSTTNFSFSFPYLNTTDIQVTVAGVATSYTWVNSSTIQISPAPASGAVCFIKRVTQISTQDVTFVNGSTINQDDLNNANLQLLYAEQEQADALQNSITLGTDGKLNANNLVIENVVNPSNPQEVATKAYVDAAYAGSPGGHAIDAHNDTVVFTDTPGDLLVVDGSQSNKWNHLGVGGLGAILAGTPTANQKMAWLAAGSNGYILNADNTKTNGISWVAPIQSLVTQKGDILVATGSGTLARFQTGLDNTLLQSDSTNSQGVSWVASPAHGQCRFICSNSTQVTVLPYNGNNLLVYSPTYSYWRSRNFGTAIIGHNTGTYLNGTPNQNLSSNTLYWVYVFDNSGTLTLDFCTVGHAPDSTTGIEVKSDTNTRTLVGLVYTNASAQFELDGALLGVISWFNRTEIASERGLTSTAATSSTSFVGIGTDCQISFCMWSGSCVTLLADGSFNTPAALDGGATTIMLDGITPTDAYSQGNFSGGTGTLPFACSALYTSSSDAVHSANIYIAVVNGGSISWNGSGTPGRRTSLKARILG